MKKFAIVLTLAALVSGRGAFAQEPATTGSAAMASTKASNNFAWGIALGTLVAIGAVVGATVAGATSTTSSTASSAH